MQPGGRGRDRALVSGKNGLVISAVLFVGRPPSGDIGWQRHLAAFSDRRIQHGSLEGKRQGHLTALRFGLNPGVELAKEADPTLVPKPYDVPRVKLACRFA